jgi:hypothetical protein
VNYKDLKILKLESGQIFEHLNKHNNMENKMATVFRTNPQTVAVERKAVTV